MSEEVKANEVPQNQKKQYLLMIDEIGMAMLSRLSPAFAFVQVEGMPLNDQPNYQVLVSPLPKPVEAPVETPTEAAPAV